MTFPAWFDFHRDRAIRRHVNAHVIYAALCARPAAFATPVVVKGWAWERELGFPRENISRALSLLVAQGYLTEHPRERAKDPRRFTVNLERRAAIPSSITYPAG